MTKIPPNTTSFLEIGAENSFELQNTGTPAPRNYLYLENLNIKLKEELDP